MPGTIHGALIARMPGTIHALILSLVVAEGYPKPGLRKHSLSDITEASNNHCLGLTTGPFVEDCAEKLGNTFVNFSRTQCAALGDELDQIRVLLDTIEQICRQVGRSVLIGIPLSSNNAMQNSPAAASSTCGCSDIVFMVDSSNSVGFSDFSKFKVFLVLMMQTLQISETCTVSLLTYSRTATPYLVHSSNKTEAIATAQSMDFNGETTRTEKAIKMLNTILRERKQDCSSTVSGTGLAVGVLLAKGTCSNWRSTLPELQAVYRDNTGSLLPFGIRMVVVNVDASSNDHNENKAKIRAIASGLNDDNIVMLSETSELNVQSSKKVADMIRWDGVTTMPGCTQWVLLDTVQTDFGDAYLGVYEPTKPCNGSQMFIHTGGEWWLGTIKFCNVLFWAVFGDDPATNDCRPRHVMAVTRQPILDTPASPGSEPWLEYGVTDRQSKIKARCYN